MPAAVAFGGQPRPSARSIWVAWLLAAKRDLRLPQELAKLDRFECLILDDIGYVQHDRDEMEVLFTLLAERCERKSVVITTNLEFSEWDRIFKDPMTTLAAIDRVVHHSVVLDLMEPRQRERSRKHAQTLKRLLMLCSHALRSLETLNLRSLQP